MPINFSITINDRSAEASADFIRQIWDAVDRAGVLWEARHKTTIQRLARGAGVPLRSGQLIRSTAIAWHPRTRQVEVSFGAFYSSFVPGPGRRVESFLLAPRLRAWIRRTFIAELYKILPPS